VLHIKLQSINVDSKLIILHNLVYSLNCLQIMALPAKVPSRYALAGRTWKAGFYEHIVRTSMVWVITGIIFATQKKRPFARFGGIRPKRALTKAKDDSDDDVFIVDNDDGDEKGVPVCT
jgi:hypothetical protein